MVLILSLSKDGDHARRLRIDHFQTTTARARFHAP